MDRLTRLRELLRENPKDSFARYGLAMELAKQGSLEEAVSEFKQLMSVAPDYVAAYLQAGQTLERLNRGSEAKAVYRQGIEVAMRNGNSHARSELEAALSLLD